MVTHLVDPLNIVDLFLLAGWSLIFWRAPDRVRDHLQTLFGIGLSVFGFFCFPALILAGRLVRAFSLIKTVLRWLEMRRRGEETIEETSFFRDLLRSLTVSILFCIGTEELVRLYFGMGLLYDSHVLTVDSLFESSNYRRRLLLIKMTFWLNLLFTLPFFGWIVWTAHPLISIPIAGNYCISLYDNWKIVRIRKKLY